MPAAWDAGCVTMGWMSFDTLAAARSLEASGMDSAQAAAVTETIRTAVDENAATKADLAELKEALTGRVVVIVGVLLAIATGVDRLLG